MSRLSAEYNVALQIEAWKKAVSLQFEEELKKSKQYAFNTLYSAWTPEKQLLEKELASIHEQIENQQKQCHKLEEENEDLLKQKTKLNQSIESERVRLSHDIDNFSSQHSVYSQYCKQLLARRQAALQPKHSELVKQINEQENMIAFFRANPETALQAEKDALDQQAQQLERSLLIATAQRDRANEQFELILKMQHEAQLRAQQAQAERTPTPPPPKRQRKQRSQTPPLSPSSDDDEQSTPSHTTSSPHNGKPSIAHTPPASDSHTDSRISHLPSTHSSLRSSATSARSPQTLPRTLHFSTGFVPNVPVGSLPIAPPETLPPVERVREERDRVESEIVWLMGTHAYSKDDQLMKELHRRRDYYDSLLNLYPNRNSLF
ncbi:hypothetical protein BLNAU_11945 [Blattamonas nauphoetae]|uniref:Uncharacterized protein n=1 Tax=Blattamonas nauphoetae TaxID=2049346 RepID=A0ABQ9XNR1_9EUKA|nr:hypothetical protein BLNAU_11945 [Blattamonas nauphoetae]